MKFCTELEKEKELTNRTDYSNLQVRKLKLVLSNALKNSIVELEESNAKGFLYIFLFYWYRLFSNRIDISSTEEGPKHFLPIMSRVPLSEVYHNLSDFDKDRVKTILDPIIKQYGIKWNINRYRRYKAGIKASDIFSLSLNRWYQSILDPSKGRNDLDLLSPPDLGNADAEQSYSMGAFDINEDQSIIIVEVRSYNSVSRKEYTIKDVAEFIIEEANWFFKIKR